MVRLRRIGVLRTATVAAVLYAIGTLIFFAFIALLVLIGGSNIPNLPGGVGSAALGGIGVLFVGLIVALLYAVFGWIITAIFCLLYNLVARITGGIEMELTTVVAAPPQPVPQWAPPPTPPTPPTGPPSDTPAA
jgi:hypothetical protein